MPYLTFPRRSESVTGTYYKLNVPMPEDNYFIDIELSRVAAGFMPGLCTEYLRIAVCGSRSFIVFYEPLSRRSR